MQLHVVRIWIQFYVVVKDMVIGGGNLGLMLLTYSLTDCEEWRVW